MNIYEIVSGPTQDQLFDCLRNWRQGRCENFWLRKKGSRIVLPATVVGINVLSFEDPSNNKWHIKLFDEAGRLGSRLLDGYYDSAKHTGNVQPLRS